MPNDSNNDGQDQVRLCRRRCRRVSLPAKGGRPPLFGVDRAAVIVLGHMEYGYPLLDWQWHSSENAGYILRKCRRQYLEEHASLPLRCDIYRLNMSRSISNLVHVVPVPPLAGLLAKFVSNPRFTRTACTGLLGWE